MTSTRRFMAWWILASAPLNWAGQFAHRYFAWQPSSELLSWGLYIAWDLLFGLGVAVAQSVVLARQRRRVRAWIGAVLVGYVCAYFFYFSLSSSMDGWVPATATFSSPLRLLESVIFLASWELAHALAEAFALWGRRWTASSLLWVTGRLSASVFISAAVWLPFSTLSPPGVIRWIASLAHEALAAAAVAWLLDRIVFRPEAECARPDASVG